MSGYHVAFAAAAVMLGAGAIILAIVVRRRDVEALELDPAAVPAAI